MNQSSCGLSEPRRERNQIGSCLHSRFVALGFFVYRPLVALLACLPEVFEASGSDGSSWSFALFLMERFPE